MSNGQYCAAGRAGGCGFSPRTHLTRQHRLSFLKGLPTTTMVIEWPTAWRMSTRLTRGTVQAHSFTTMDHAKGTGGHQVPLRCSLSRPRWPPSTETLRILTSGCMSQCTLEIPRTSLIVVLQGSWQPQGGHQQLLGLSSSSPSMRGKQDTKSTTHCAPRRNLRATQ